MRGWHNGVKKFDLVELSMIWNNKPSLTLHLGTNNMDVARTRSQTRSQTAQSSMVINLNAQTVSALNTLNDDFVEQMQQDGNDFLHSLQRQRLVRQLVGGGSITYALMILIEWHITCSELTIFSEASDDFCNVRRGEDDWGTEAVIARQIIYMFPNTETIEDIINDGVPPLDPDSRLSIEIRRAVSNYGTLTIPEAPG
tara:strand:- start:97 stop:690 length:594 start_codon:yes stop_codon:yes gene_type:complete